MAAVVERARRLAGADRREQVLKIAAAEFAAHGLHGVSAEVIARKAGITHAYVFRLFGTKKRLFLEVVRRAFAAMAGGLAEAAGPATGLEALAAMGRRYDAGPADRTLLLLQLQAFAACGDAEVRAAVRVSFGELSRVPDNGRRPSAGAHADVHRPDRRGGGRPRGAADHRGGG
ncbi:TetR/AcrR family transcriptional regulator [Nonomuraea sp. NPDC000554]|uniref:TetR/AcrR family transcriptional regulator n=1 Tax=Nonomuraea sp. NPDC000554 TaxID=3154259 RepID=UPI00331D3E0A